MKLFRQKKTRKAFRSLHRDIGYLFIGLTCIYAISGILLNIKTEGEDPAFRKNIIESSMQHNLNPQELSRAWNKIYQGNPKLNRVIPHDNKYRLYLKGGTGEYNPETGKILCVTYHEIKAIKLINDIHYNSGKRFTWLANVFAVSLLFLAISGAVIVQGKKGFKKRGVWIMLFGLLVPIAWYYLFQ